MEGLGGFVMFILIMVILAGSNKGLAAIRVLNRTNLELTDCPLVDVNVTDLILHGNLLKDLNTNNCQTLVHLNRLTVSSNRLYVVPNFQTFKHLKILNLSNNKLRNLNIFSPSLVKLDISHNIIVDVTGSKLDNLTVFMAGHNNINTASMGRILNLLRNSPAIEIVDVSFNLIDWLPNQMRSFSPSNLLLINLSGNKLRAIDFGFFNRNIGQGYRIDLSYNEITNLSIHDVINVRYLNLSNNKLSWIDGESMENFVGLEGIDLSYNPLNCLCHESTPFMRWMFAHLIIVSSPLKTKCGSPAGELLFNISCKHKSLPPGIVTSPISLTPTKSVTHVDQVSASSHNTHSSRPINKFNHTASPRSRIAHLSHGPELSLNTSSYVTSSSTQLLMKKHWKLAIGIIILIASCITLVMLVWFCHRRSRRYHILTEYDDDESTRHCITFLPFQSSNEMNVFTKETHAIEEEHLHVL